MKLRWIVLALAGLILVAAWAAVVVAKVFFEPSLMQWTGLVTVAAIATEGFLWVAAGVFGWGFLAKRKAALVRWRDRIFGRRGAPQRNGE